MFILSQKLKLLKSRLKVQNKETFGNVPDLLRKATSSLEDIQAQIQSEGQSDDLLIIKKKAQLEMETSLKLEDVFWKEKSKVKWHHEGDRNTAYFQRITKVKNFTKLIYSI
ncbi:unnamed protein product [Lathyrus sativus]|nr:unnamed protein product [Lathyrus sativus]